MLHLLSSCHHYLCTLGIILAVCCLLLLTNTHSLPYRNVSYCLLPVVFRSLLLSAVLHCWKPKDSTLVCSLPLRLSHSNKLWLVATQYRSSPLKAKGSCQHPLIASVGMRCRLFPLGNGPSGPPWRCNHFRFCTVAEYTHPRIHSFYVCTIVWLVGVTVLQ